MTRSRVFIPSTVEALATFLSAGEIGPAPFPAHCAEPLRGEHPELDDEEAEYAAMAAASLQSLSLLSSQGPAVRVVLAADVPTYTEDGPEPTQITVTSAVPWRDVAAVHVDTSDAADAVAAAIADPTAESLVDAVLSHELAWFARQEIPDLLRSIAE